MRSSTEPGLRHSAVFFSSDEERRQAMVESIADGLNRSESVLAAIHPSDQKAVAELLGPAARAVEFADARDTYRDPSSAMRDLGAVLAGRPSGERVRIVGCARPTVDSYPEWIRCEAAINEIFPDTAATGVCFHDHRTVAGDLRRLIEETHPYLGPTGASSPSPHYSPPRAVAASLPVRTLHPDRAPDFWCPVHSEIRPIRIVGRQLAPPGRSEDVAMVVHELVALTRLAEATSPEVRFWRDPAGLVVQVAGSRVFDDPFAGLRPPERGGGLALWMAGQLADALAVEHSAPVPALTVAFYA